MGYHRQVLQRRLENRGITPPWLEDPGKEGKKKSLLDDDEEDQVVVKPVPPPPKKSRPRMKI